MAERIMKSDDGQTAERTTPTRKTVYTLGDIARLAESVQALCSDVINDSDATWEDETVQKAVAARDLACQIGALADIGMRDLGEPLMCRHPDAAGWLCSPAYHAEQEEVSHG